MKWRNLIQKKCPLCSEDLKLDREKEIIYCDGPLCSFYIAIKRYRELVQSI